MHILIITRTFPPGPGAVGHLVKELAGEWVKRGWDVTVVASGQADPADKASSWKVCRARALPFTRNSLLLRALSYISLYPSMLWTAARQRRPDVIITTTDPPLQAVLGVVLASVFRCKSVHWCQDLYPEMAEEMGVIKKSGVLASVLRWISTYALKRHDHVVPIGRCMTAHLRRRGILGSQITEIANWTDPDLIHPIPDTENEFIRRENLADRFVVLYSGNLGLAHSFDEILDAAAILQTSAPEVLFLFIGEGPRRKLVEQEAKKRELSSIRFLPPQPWKDLPQSLSAAALHLVSLRESLSGLVVPSKFYGGMAAGRPCLFIGPGNSEIARLIRESQAGKVVSDGESLAEAILGYLREPEKRLADGARARQLGLRSTLKNAVHAFKPLLSNQTAAK